MNFHNGYLSFLWYDRSETGLSLSAFVGVNYLSKYAFHTHYLNLHLISVTSGRFAYHKKTQLPIEQQVVISVETLCKEEYWQT